MQKKTIRVSGRSVFIFLFLLIIAVTGFMFIRAYGVMQEGSPTPLTDYENIELIQFAPLDNTKKAVISTTAGDITVALFEAETPGAVDIFTSSAESGLYNGLTAGLYEQHTVFTLDVPPRENVYTIELHKNLWPFKGALCMNTEGDIIFINTIPFTDEDREYLSAEEGELSEVRSAFLEQGGVPNYSGQYAVFGQITEGIDVMEKIANADQAAVITVTGVSLYEEESNKTQPTD
ncbi:MAG: peptidylprolyl isomerase [Oscillospiraceae bacterium]|nr:peptidylprolyl isomerase [Oscillospiraceae bacterium]